MFSSGLFITPSADDPVSGLGSERFAAAPKSLKFWQYSFFCSLLILVFHNRSENDGFFFFFLPRISTKHTWKNIFFLGDISHRAVVLKMRSWTGSIRIPWELVGNADPQALPSPTELETLGGRSSSLCFNTSSRWFWEWESQGLRASTSTWGHQPGPWGKGVGLPSIL